MVWGTGPQLPGHGPFETGLCEQWASLHTQSSTHARSSTCAKKRRLSEGHLCLHAKLHLWEQRTLTHEAPFTQMELREQAQAPSAHASFVHKSPPLKRPLFLQVELRTWAQGPTAHAQNSIRMNRGRAHLPLAPMELCAHMYLSVTRPPMCRPAKVERLEAAGLRHSLW